MTKYSFIHTGTADDWKMHGLVYSLNTAIPILRLGHISPRFLNHNVDTVNRTAYFEYNDEVCKTVAILKMPERAEMTTLRHILCTQTGKLQVYVDDHRKIDWDANINAICQATLTGDIHSLHEYIAAQRILLGAPAPGELRLLLTATNLPDNVCDSIINLIPNGPWSHGTFQKALFLSIAQNRDDQEEALEVLLKHSDLEKQDVLEMISNGFFCRNLRSKSKPDIWLPFGIYPTIYVHCRVFQHFKLTYDEVMAAFPANHLNPFIC
jgi:hypothetical protein